MSQNLELPFDDAVPEVPEPNEGMEDLPTLTPALVSQAVVSGTDWTAETIISQINKGNIQLNPKFQRRDAWDQHRKSRFIESLILGLPVPQLVLAESRERKGAYIVIDGKQRLLSIRQFASEPGDITYGSTLRLAGLAIRKDLGGKSLSDIRSDPSFLNDISAFENQPIRTIVVKNWPNDAFLYHVFLRLNTGSVPLSPQELRQALHPGPFVDFADTRSGDSPALRELLNLKKPDFRMRDVELFIRYYAFGIFLNEYAGDLRSFLDLICARLNNQWGIREDELRGRADEFEAAYATARDVFGAKNVFRKWTGQTYERSLNRAVFDTIMYHLGDAGTRDLVSQNAAEVRAAFQELCVNDAVFLASIERTTKSLGATCTRLATWARTLNNRIGTQLHVPSLVDGRIV